MLLVERQPKGRVKQCVFLSKSRLNFHDVCPTETIWNPKGMNVPLLAVPLAIYIYKF